MKVKFLKEINGAFSVTLLCKSNCFFFTPFRFLDIYMKILYDTDAKNGIYLVLYPYAAHRRCCGAILAYASLISVPPLLDSNRRSEPLCLLWNNRNWFFNFLLLSSTIGKTWTNMVTDMYMYKRNIKHRPTNSYYIYKCSCVCKQTYRSYNINHLLTNK